MARLLFPDAASIDRVQATAGLPLLSSSGATARVYADAAGTQLADIQNADGSPNVTATLVLDNQSRLPTFLGPAAGTEVLYVRVDGGAPLMVEATLGQRFAAQDVRVDETLADFQTAERAFNSTTYPAGVIVTGAGIDPTGAADSTAAIQAKIDLAVSRKAVLYWPEGKFKASGLTVGGQLTMRGAGMGDNYGGTGRAAGATYPSFALQAPTVLFTDSPTAVLLTVNDAAFNMQDMAIACTAATVPTAGAGLRLTQGDEFRLTRCRFSGFYDNVSVEQSQYAALMACVFLDSIRYGLRLRNLVNPDQGDMTILGCNFTHSGTHSRIGGSAVRIESSGGIKLLGVKINEEGGGRYDKGIDLYNDTAATSILQVIGGSIEGIAGDAISLVVIGAAQYGLITISGVQFGLYNNGVGRCVYASADQANTFRQLVLTGCHFRQTGTATVPAVVLNRIHNFDISHNTRSGFTRRSLITNSVDGVDRPVAGDRFLAVGSGAADTTTTSTVYVDLATFPLVKVRAQAGDILIVNISGNVYTNQAAATGVDFVIAVGGVDMTQQVRRVTTTASLQQFVFSHQVIVTVAEADVGSDQVTLRVRWKTAAGTAGFTNSGGITGSLQVRNVGPTIPTSL